VMRVTVVMTVVPVRDPRSWLKTSDLMVTGTVWDGMRMRPRSMKSKSPQARCRSITRTSELMPDFFLEGMAPRVCRRRRRART